MFASDLGSSAVVPFVMLVIMRCALALPKSAYMRAYTDSRNAKGLQTFVYKPLILLVAGAGFGIQKRIRIT